MIESCRPIWPWLAAGGVAVALGPLVELAYLARTDSALRMNAATVVAGERAPTAAAVVIVANDYGHFDVTATIDGVATRLMTDTGATFVALTYETAETLGYNEASLRFTGRSATANGVVRVAPITLGEVRIGDVVLNNVLAVVGERGKMGQNLLGMSFINRLGGFELKAGRLVMRR